MLIILFGLRSLEVALGKYLLSRKSQRTSFWYSFQENFHIEKQAGFIDSRSRDQIIASIEAWPSSYCAPTGSVRDSNCVLVFIALVDECVLLMSVCWTNVSVPGRLLSIELWKKLIGFAGQDIQ